MRYSRGEKTERERDGGVVEVCVVADKGSVAFRSSPCRARVPPTPGALFAGPWWHADLLFSVLPNPGASAGDRSAVLVANALPREAVNVRELGAVSVY